MIEDCAVAFPYDARVIWFVWRRDRLDKLEVCIEQSALQALPGSQASVGEHVTSDQADYAMKHTLVAKDFHEELATRTANGGHVE
jgi:hypothetical protein